MSRLEETLLKIEPFDEAFAQKARQHLETLTMPHWALGKLLDLGVTLAGITRSLSPSVERKAIVVMAADHGISEEHVSLYPQEVTRQMVVNFLQGGAAINAMAGQAGAKVIVVDMGVKTDHWPVPYSKIFLSKKVALGTKNALRENAMTHKEAIASIEAGIDIAYQFKNDFDVFGTGEMGIGNTTLSAAIGSVITGKDVSLMTGRGTGIDDHQLQRKISMIHSMLDQRKVNPKDAIDILSKIGGFEIGGLAGLILGCAALRKPVVMDGFISTAAAMIARLLHPVSMDYVIPSHQSMEQGHRVMLEYLGKNAFFDLNFRLGEGTGAVFMMNLIEATVHVMTQVATFEQAGVSKSST